MILQTDPTRNGDTGIFVRAQDINGKWVTVDMCCLTKASLLEFLKSRGGDNRWAENIVGILLGHSHLHELQPPKDSDKESGK